MKRRRSVARVLPQAQPIRPVAPAAGEPRILALDVASHCGWACSDGTSGVWDLSGWTDIGRRAEKLVDRLQEAHVKQPFDRLAMESLIAFGHHGERMQGLLVVAQLVGAVKFWAASLELPRMEFSPAEIKQFATGKGNATKDMMLAAARREGRDFGERDDECDAWWCLKLAQSRIRLGVA